MFGRGLDAEGARLLAARPLLLDVGERKQKGHETKQNGAWDTRQEQAGCHYEGLDSSRPHHPVGHTAHRARRGVQHRVGHLTAKPPEDLT